MSQSAETAPIRPDPVSVCCGARLRPHEGEEGTHWWTCSECKRPADEDSFCTDCQKRLSAHEKCDGCEHYVCDCICDFLRDDWPTHPSNPDAREETP